MVFLLFYAEKASTQAIQEVKNVEVKKEVKSEQMVDSSDSEESGDEESDDDQVVLLLKTLFKCFFFFICSMKKSNFCIPRNLILSCLIHI